MNYSKKGAMFGLDARVALAIFGALSLITGASLYSAFQNAKVVAIVTEMNNVDKAATEYLLATGSYLGGVSGIDTGELKLEELISSTASGWKGPYIVFQDDAEPDDGELVHPIYNLVKIFRNQDIDWDTPLESNRCLSGSSTCSVYVCYHSVPLDVLKAVDLKIDGTDAGDTGNFRYKDTGIGCKRGMTYDKSLAPASGNNP
ncbi:MAG: hypothetical protein GY793_10760 [Proteobacteria bacterium]|nr:hypothetical protein [Pseudomonadota bacterium]